jgi:hypothetical protein
MSRLKLILLPSVLTLTLTLALPAWAETGLETTPSAPIRPLNLSLPRDVLQHAPGVEQPDEAVVRNLGTPYQNGNRLETPARPTNLPYGAGYEHRHQEMGGTTGGGSKPGAGAGSGAGRRGR